MQCDEEKNCDYDKVELKDCVLAIQNAGDCSYIQQATNKFIVDPKKDEVVALRQSNLVRQYLQASWRWHLPNKTERN